MLPIDEYLPVIASKLITGNNLVLQAEPGAGKSTALPLSLLDIGWLKGKKILMLEPRRVAAKSIAHYLARQLGEKVGQRIGYQIKNERKITKDTVLEIVTEGILTRRLQSDPEISDIGLIIFDEFHERSIHADLSLLLSLEIQQTIREDLKLLVMSATIDTGLMSRYMGGADIIECPGRAFPVSVEYIQAKKDPLVRLVTNALRSALEADKKGDILVFLPGQADINRCISESNNIFDTDPTILFLPLYGGLPLSQQEQALIPDPGGKRRIIFTTNIAETSLTIEGVTCVIDSGLEKVLIYDPASCMTRLETTYISKASAEQRKGRAGRTQAGACIRLWDEQKQRSLRDFQGEEVLSADLSAFVLELYIWGAGNYDDINWLTPPPKPHFLSAQATLVSLGLIDADNKV
ncbi:MAG: DEAD/DEAH box helicase, partial [Pseudomonadales bacterium]|nr:DEAD/DEAH box helicase [Pseudomonadales bacterium]